MRSLYSRRLRAAAYATGLLCWAFATHAQVGAWKPEKNIEIVVGLTAGSSQDRGARAIQSIAQARALLNMTSGSTIRSRICGKVITLTPPITRAS